MLLNIILALKVLIHAFICRRMGEAKYQKCPLYQTFLPRMMHKTKLQKSNHINQILKTMIKSQMIPKTPFVNKKCLENLRHMYLLSIQGYLVHVQTKSFDLRQEGEKNTGRI